VAVRQAFGVLGRGSHTRRGIGESRPLGRAVLRTAAKRGIDIWPSRAPLRRLRVAAKRGSLGGVRCFGGLLAATGNAEPPPPMHGDQAARRIRRAPMAMDPLGSLNC
jgi:hypothetical protein